MEIVIDNKLLENFYCYPCQFCEIFPHGFQVSCFSEFNGTFPISTTFLF